MPRDMKPVYPSTIALIGKYHSPEVAESLGRLATYLVSRGCRVLVERETAEHAGQCLDPRHFAVAEFAGMGEAVDVAIVVGGDGTLLNAARHLARQGVPLVGVNQGRLGFMTDIALADMLSCMDDLLDGCFRREYRLLLDATVIRAGQTLATNLAFNDVVLDKGAIGRMIEFELFIDGEFIYNLRADGLIVSTPTGSTAYALSANGPILHPGLGGIALVPLCPHALSNRPITVAEQCEIEVRLLHAADCRVHFDGQLTLDLKPGDAIRLQRSAHQVCLLHPPGYSYFAMLRQKLHWSERPRGGA